MPDFLVDAVATANVNLASPPSTIDTFALVAGTSRVALAGQTNATENGIYDYTATPALVRNATDGAAASMVYPRNFGVRQGSPDNKHSEWQFDNDTTPTLGTTSITINRYAWPRVLDASGGLRRSGPDLSVATTGILAGTYSRLTVNERGLATVGQAAEEAATFVEGLRLVWLSANSLRVEEGAAYIPTSGRIVDMPLDSDLAGLVLTASTWYFAYFFESGGAGAVELSTQAPVTVPYRGRARAKGPDATPDETRRYIGAVRVGGTASTMLRFRRRASYVSYVEDEGTTLRLLSGLANTTRAVRSAAALVPPTSRQCRFRINTNGSSGMTYDANEGPVDAVSIQAARAGFPVVDLDAAQQFGQKNLAASGSTDIGVLGFFEEIA